MPEIVPNTKRQCPCACHWLNKRLPGPRFTHTQPRACCGRAIIRPRTLQAVIHYEKPTITVNEKPPLESLEVQQAFAPVKEAIARLQDAIRDHTHDET